MSSNGTSTSTTTPNTATTISNQKIPPSYGFRVGRIESSSRELQGFWSGIAIQPKPTGSHYLVTYSPRDDISVQVYDPSTDSTTKDPKLTNSEYCAIVPNEDVRIRLRMILLTHSSSRGYCDHVKEIHTDPLYCPRWPCFMDDRSKCPYCPIIAKKICTAWYPTTARDDNDGDDMMSSSSTSTIIDDLGESLHKKSAAFGKGELVLDLDKEFEYQGWQIYLYNKLYHIWKYDMLYNSFFSYNVAISRIRELRDLQKSTKIRVNDGWLIGISGKFGSGKDTSGAIILDLINAMQLLSSDESTQQAPQQKAYADLIKRRVSVLTEIPTDLMHTEDGKALFIPLFKKTIGQLLQEEGKHLRTVYGEDILMRSLFSKYDPNKKWVITDVRLKTEAQKIKDLGGILIRMHGDPKNIRAENKSKRDLNDKTETDLDDYNFDVEIDNSKPGLEQLRKTLKSFVDRFFQ